MKIVKRNDELCSETMIYSRVLCTFVGSFADEYKNKFKNQHT